MFLFSRHFFYCGTFRQKWIVVLEIIDTQSKYFFIIVCVIGNIV